MKALSLWQPWASLVGLGIKTVETRSWSTSYRGPLAIHATARPAEVGLRLGPWSVSQLRDGRTIHSYPPDERARGWYLLPLGAVIATCELVDVVPIIAPDQWLDPGWAKHVAPSRNGGPLWLWLGPSETENSSTGRPTWRHQEIEDQRPFGDFTPGRFAWLLEDIRPLAEPVPARGRQQLWEWAA